MWPFALDVRHDNLEEEEKSSPKNEVFSSQTFFTLTWGTCQQYKSKSYKINFSLKRNKRSDYSTIKFLDSVSLPTVW